MRFVVFTHSLASDWNHGNAHFLRGVCCELLARGHEVIAFEPEGAWSRTNLIADAGDGADEAWRTVYPALTSRVYQGLPDFDEALDGADVVLVHEWNEHSLVAAIGNHRARRGSYTLLFHDTHHRSVTAPESMSQYDLSGYDGVLAFGASVAEQYEKRGWANAVWVWHEAADTRVFRPLASEKEGDLVWIGNWGDDERTAELREFLLEPVRQLGFQATVHGVRYPQAAREELSQAGIAYRGYLPNFRAPEVFARYLMTIHIPRRPYAEALRGVPTIRVFEALACGIPLVSAPWDDSEGLFTPGEDFLVARSGEEMRRQLQALHEDAAMRRAIAERGLKTIQQRHTCAHRVEELLQIVGKAREERYASAVDVAQ